jgi:plastocyanin
MKLRKNFLPASLSLILFLAISVSGIHATTHLIQFGGTFGLNYFPNLIYVAVGDTIQWKGDFTTYELESTSVPAGAAPFGPVMTGSSFLYPVTAEGTYTYQNKVYAQIGMTGSFVATRVPHGSLTNEGREFFLGMMYPSYNTVAVTSVKQRYFHVDALITTYYDNVIHVGYFNGSGTEVNTSDHILQAKHALDLGLDDQALQSDTNSEIPQYKSLHITSKYPISVHYLSAGGCAGGSYLALPALGLGKKYVIASFNDNPGGGAIFREGSTKLPTTFDDAGGEFMVIGTQDGTNVTITPNTTTRGGHIGMHTGSNSSGTAIPFTVSLNRGESFLVRSNGQDDNSDMSGSIVEASNPVAVLAGHENATLGGVDPYILDARDFMIEQMIPVELWDSGGYVSFPLAEASPPGQVGQGDTYRVYAYDNTTVNVQADVGGISGGNQLVTSRLSSPAAELTDVTTPVEFYSTNAHKISVMQYDERSQPFKGPWPAPSMMTVIPISRWRKSYDFYVPTRSASESILDYPYVNVISPPSATINVSVDGGTPRSIVSFPAAGNVPSVSNRYALKGVRYKLPGGSAYRLTSDSSFMVYMYGMRDVAVDSTHLGNDDSTNLHSEYAAPAGIQLNNGGISTLSISVDTLSKCTGWHVCVTDLGTNDPGVKAVMLIDDTDGVYFDQVGEKFNNVAFDATSLDFSNGELHPSWHSSQAYCFDVNVTNLAAAANAPLAIYDNNGNATIFKLQRGAPTLSVSTTPPTSHPDSIYFAQQKIGTQICSTLVFKNTAAAGSLPINIISAQLQNTDSVFNIQSVTPPLPFLLPAQSSVTIQLCYTSKDNLPHRDSLFLNTDCFAIPISVQEFSTSGLIFAGDLNFDSVKVGDELCKDIQVKNTGSSSFTLTKGAKLGDGLNFAIAPAFLATLPLVIQAGQSITVSICFHPQATGFDSSGIDWSTDIDGAFNSFMKGHSIIKGVGFQNSSVSAEHASKQFSLRPNPVTGNSVVAYFSDPVWTKASISLYDVLGREVYREFVIPGTARLEIPLRNLSQGVYYVRFSSDLGQQTQQVEVLK